MILTMNYTNIPSEYLAIFFYCLIAFIFGSLITLLLLEIIHTKKKRRTKKQGNLVSVRIEKDDDNDRLLIYEDTVQPYRHRTIRLKKHEYESLKYYFAQHIPIGLLLEIIDLYRDLPIESTRESKLEIAEKAYVIYRDLYDDND